MSSSGLLSAYPKLERSRDREKERKREKEKKRKREREKERKRDRAGGRERGREKEVYMGVGSTYKNHY